MKKIAFVATHGGAYKTLLPVAEWLIGEGYSIGWISEQDSIAGQRLKEKGQDFTHFEHEQINYTTYDVIVTGVSGLAPEAETFCAQEAMAQSVPVVKVIDFWGTGMPHEKGLAPDRLCVLDEPSVTYEAQMRKMPKENIRVTGDPKMDALVKVDKSGEAHYSNKAAIGTRSGYFIVFTGPSSQERVMEVFPALINAVKGGKVLVEVHRASGFYKHMPVTIGTLWHPSHSGRKEKDGKIIYENKQDIDPCYQLLQDAEIPFISDADLRTVLSNPEVYVAADLVVGVTSTETVVSCCLQRPTLNIIYPGGINYNDILAPKEMASIPTVECGAALLAKSASEVSEIINNIWQIGEFPCPVMKKAQEEFYNLDGKNIKRVVEVIKELL